MKRALLPVVAAALLLTACGGEDTTAGSSSSATSSSTASSEASPSLPSGAEVNAQVREACQLAVGEQAPGATFPTAGTLRATSGGEDGKLFTVIGTADVSGEQTRYTCEVLAGEELEVVSATVGG
ncbi:hypothetical protein [Thalassiella azotivora]